MMKNKLNSKANMLTLLLLGLFWFCKKKQDLHPSDKAALAELAKYSSYESEGGRIVKISIRNRDLTEIPVQVFRFAKLRVLDLQGNTITEPNAKLFELIPALEELSLQDNLLEKIPEEIKNLKNLHKLNLRKNKISEVPLVLGSLPLQSLDISDNKLTVFPEALLNLNDLQRLWLQSNEIADLPAQIAQLESLLYLNVSHNKLTGLPEELWTIKSLENLLFYQNQIQGEISENLKNLQNLQVLNISDNKITKVLAYAILLPNLRILNVHDNEINETLPENLKDLRYLKNLVLHNNPAITGVLPLQLLELPDLVEIKIANTGIDKANLAPFTQKEGLETDIQL